MSALTNHDLSAFASLGIPQELLTRARIERVTDAEAREKYGIRGGGDMSGIAFQYFQPASMLNGDPWRRWYVRIRRDNPEVEDGRPKKKYVVPHGGRKHFYFPPRPELFADVAAPIILVESEKAALSLTAWSERMKREMLAIGLGGAWGFRAKVGIKQTATGKHVPETGPIPDLRIARDGREVFVLLDANCAVNENVQGARRELVKQLYKQGAVVRIIDLPGGDGINGPDDFISLRGDEAMAQIIDGRIDGAELLDELDRYLRRFAILTKDQSTVLAVYILHTHMVKAGRFTPYIHVHSAVLRSGKTRVLELLKLFVHNPWMTERVSAAALVRKMARSRPTLLLDETDTAFSVDKEYSEALRGILNAGFQEGGAAHLCVKKNGDWEVEEFQVFGPKVVAGIGIDRLPATVRDRSIPIEMKRRAAGELIEDFDTEDELIASRPIRERIELWGKQNLSSIKAWPKPEKLAVLTDRQRDICNPLLKIAELVGGNWKPKLSSALTTIFATREDDEPIGIKLLSDIRDAFEARQKDRIFSEDLAAALAQVETSPWAEWKSGKALTVIQLARQLKPFKICPRNIRLAERQAKGYDRDQFSDVWGRYLSSAAPDASIPPIRPVPASQASINASETQFSTRPTNDNGTSSKTQESSMFMRLGTGGTTQNPELRERAQPERCYVHGTNTTWWHRPEGEAVCERCHPKPGVDWGDKKLEASETLSETKAANA